MPNYITKNGGIAMIGQEARAYIYFVLNKNKIRRKIKMQKISSKIVAIAISLLMIFSLGGYSTSLIQNAHAQTTVNVPNVGYINVDPNPCGVGQIVTIDFWLGVPLLDSSHPVGFIIYIGLPSGTNTTLGPFIGDETGGSHTTYTPEAAGTYTFYMTYPGQQLTTPGYTQYYEEPATSPTETLTVTSTPATEFPFTPLPTTYWQTPIDAQNVQNWYAISGPWLGLAAQSFATTGLYNASNDYNPYTLAPSTGHILWTKPWAEGGVAGGDAGPTEESDYWITSQYEPKWAPVVINGIMYSTWYTTTTAYSNGIMAVNLYNGQTLWIINTTNPLRCGMVTYYQTINQYGYIGPYIWTQGPLPASVTGGTAYNSQPGSTQWNMYDGLTGNYIESIVNGTAGNYLSNDANGNMLLYYENLTVGTQIIYPNQVPSSAVAVTTTGPSLCMFNFTQCIQTGGQWDPAFDNQYRFNLGIMNEVTLPSIITNINSSPAGFALNGFGSNTIMVESGMIISGPFVTDTTQYLYMEGFSATNLALLWTSNVTETPYCRLGRSNGYGLTSQINLETDVDNAYSLTTGDLLWTNTLTGLNGGPVDAYDNFDINQLLTPSVDYVYGFGGDIWALNMANGDLLWYTNTTALFGSPGLETPYGTWPLWIFSNAVTNGQLIMYAEGHEYDPPLFHGAQEFALNCTTGQLVWSLNNYLTTGAELSYGIQLGLNSYDGQIYAIGQGPSQTTVTAPDTEQTVGVPMIISGTVMDVSAGASQEAVKADFPNGLPCVSDADQGHFMAAVYEQQVMPTDMTGVPITVTAIDPNGNLVTLGTTTSTASGYWGITWTPPAVPGNYTIIATFAGTGAYYGSSAQTFAYVGSAPTPAPATATPLSQATTQMYVLSIGIAAIIVIIIIGAVLALLILRKKA